MSSSPNFRVIVDGDASKVYRQGDQVKGRVDLILEDDVQVKELKVHFVGAVITKTSRPIYVSGNGTEPGNNRREYEEQVRLFNIEQSLVSSTVLTANKYSWNFEYTFPKLTEASYSKWAHGSKYLKNPHPLPPSVTIHTNLPGGKATISYYIQARLQGPTDTRKTTQYLAYQPPSPPDATLEPKITTRVMYAQSWKPSEGKRTAKDKFFRKSKDNKNNPCIVPTLHFPEKVAAGQHIPLLLSLSNAYNSDQPECVVDTLNISISTYTTVMCGSSCTQPEDVLAKHVTCVSKQNMDLPISFDVPVKLTSNFRLVDDNECVPTFKTYTITRRYAMTIAVGVRLVETGQKFTIRSSYPLDIVPKIPVQELRARGFLIDDDIEDDPLPLYRPREYSMELAPDYEALYSLSPTPSTSDTLNTIHSASTSSWSGASTPFTIPNTPESEIDQPVF
ncbi:hypothetical protein B0J11DRAFT_130869 [Dendryphion nanum]|uniref:Arrestin-like N-terminal domain-containing protein n=1 Tax=Dendryphion nanum TaxID=256645 RepID=A0A9P9D7P7_9PLEO|nr:hypothetical protein B0J11DRAFT_130869 [Dendryphion nanum]